MGMKLRAEHGLSGLYKKPCFGYKKNDEGNLIPDEEQSKIVKRIYELYLSGTSIIGIINTLAEEQIPSPMEAKHGARRRFQRSLLTPSIPAMCRS